MPTYDALANRLLDFENGEFGAGASEPEIAAAERALGVPIAGGYRRFLAQFGWGGVEHLELYGLGRDVPAHLELIALTQSERAEMHPALNRHLLPLMNDGGGNLYCIDTRVADEPPVVFWDHSAAADQQPDVHAKDFAAWFEDQLDALD